MEEEFISEDVRKRLILSGLRELEEFGMRDFSLRRVAIAAGVSCAAPYRHFKDKDELIISIIEYVKEGWDLISREILETYGVGSPDTIVEIAIMLVRFWLGNKSIRSILLLSSCDDGFEEGRKKLKSFDEPLLDCIRIFAMLRSFTEEDKSVLTLTLLTLIYGSINIIISGTADIDSVIRNLKSKVIQELINFL